MNPPRPVRHSVCTLLSLFLLLPFVAAALPEAASDSTPAASPGRAAPRKPRVIPLITAKNPAQYTITTSPANIAPTRATMDIGTVKVFGKPRIAQGHPCTLWDKEDVDYLKARLKTDKELQDAFEKLKANTDARLTKPLNVPIARKKEDGTWMWPNDFPEGEAPYKQLGPTNQANADDMANLGVMYALTGESKYADFAKKLLITYADNYNNYGHPDNYTDKYRNAVDGRLTHQFLEDGFWLNRAAFGYDLIYNLPGWTAEERKHIRDDLFKAIALEFYANAGEGNDYISGKHNRAAISNAGVLSAGYATEDEGMINTALYGVGGTKEKPTGGSIQVHFGPECILPDGIWIEGSPAYQVGIASCGLVNNAEIMWRHGIDMYSHRNGILKRMFDSAIQLAYPDDRLIVAALHDSGRTQLLDPREFANNQTGLSYEAGYQRYHEPSYLPIVANAIKRLSMTVHTGSPSLFFDVPPKETAPPRKIENVNFFAVGYGVQRVPAAEGWNQLIVEFGPSAGHAHPSKLAIDLYAFGDVFMPFPGVVFPYGLELNPTWYWTTLAHCTLTVDETNQLYSKNKYKAPKGTPDGVGEQMVFGPAQTMGIQRVWSNTIQPGVTEDRALFITGNYLADIFGAFSDTPHKYDMAWHIRGELSTDLPLQPYKFPDPVANGYNALSEVRNATADKAYSISMKGPSGKPAKLLAAADQKTEVIVGRGHFFTKTRHEDEQPPAILQRRSGINNTIFGNAADVSGDASGFVKGVTQEGDLDKGYALLKVETVQGTDLCFASYRAGNFSTNGMETDAAQAFVQMDGKNVQAMYLGGGKKLKVEGGTLERSEPGLAYVESTKAGSYIVANPSSSEATVTITLPALSGLKAFNLDDKGQRAGEASVTGKPALALTLKPMSSVEFSAN